MLGLGTPQPAEMAALAVFLMLIHILANRLVPRYPKIVDTCCALVLAAALISAWNLLGEGISLTIPRNGWTIAAVGLLGLPGVWLLFLARLILL